MDPFPAPGWVQVVTRCATAGSTGVGRVGDLKAALDPFHVALEFEHPALEEDGVAVLGRHVRAQGRETLAHPFEAREACLNVLQDLVNQAAVDPSNRPWRS
jgi:hypothetical protein